MAIFLSSTVTSSRSMSDRAQTVSCERLPQRSAARIDLSFCTWRISRSRAAANACGTDSSLMSSRFVVRGSPRQFGPDFARDRRDQRAADFLILDPADEDDEHVRARPVDDRRVMVDLRDVARLVA